MRFQDLRGKLPVHDTKNFGARDAGDLRGVVLHHTAGSDDWEEIAHYAVSPNHISPTGTPGIDYTIGIDLGGVVSWLQDLDVNTWSQGNAGNVTPRGGDANGNYLALCLGGNFYDAEGNRSGKEPPFSQVHALLIVLAHLQGMERDSRLPVEWWGLLPQGAIFSHGGDFGGGTVCPGEFYRRLAASLKTDANRRLNSDLEWQQALMAAGYDLPRWGADGSWGSESRAALAAFQRDKGLPVTGQRDRASEVELAAYLVR